MFPIHRFCFPKQDAPSVSGSSTRLLEVVRRGGFKELRKTLGRDPKAAMIPDDNGWLPLHVAAYWKGSNAEYMGTIFDAYPSAAEVKNNSDSLPLHIALSSHASDKTVRMLFKAYAKAAEIQNKYGHLPLHLACYRWNVSIETIQMIYDANPKAVEIQDNEGWLPLHHACGSDFYIMDPVKYLKYMDLLLSSYPDSMNVKTYKNEFPHDTLKTKTNIDLKLACRLLNQAVQLSLSPHLVRLLLQAFPKIILKRDKEGMVPLHHACTINNPDYFENVIILLEFNANSITIADDKGRTPLQILSRRLTVADGVGMLSLHHIASRSVVLSVKTCKILVDIFPKCITTPDKNGLLPFHHACLNAAIMIDVVLYFLLLFPESIQPIDAHLEFQSEEKDL
jgi:ankyrin repeat protein